MSYIDDQLKNLQEHKTRHRDRVLAAGTHAALQKWRPNMVRHGLIVKAYYDVFHKYEDEVEGVAAEVDRLVTGELHHPETLDSVEVFADRLLPGAYVLDQHPNSTPTFVKVGWADNLAERRAQHRGLAPMNQVIGFVPRLWTNLIPEALEGRFKSEGQTRWGRYGGSSEAFRAPSVEDVQDFFDKLQAELIVR